MEAVDGVESGAAKAVAALRFEADQDGWSDKGGRFRSFLKWTRFKGWRELVCTDAEGNRSLVLVVEAGDGDEDKLLKFTRDACSYLELDGALLIENDGKTLTIGKDGKTIPGTGTIDCGDRHAIAEALLGKGARIRKPGRLKIPKIDSKIQEAIVKVYFSKLDEPKAENYFKSIEIFR